VKWEDRIIEIREGSWSYIANASSVGYAPEKVVGTATPEKDQQDSKVVWRFSTGDVLTVKLGDDLNFHIRNESSGEEVWCHKLLRLCAFCVELDLEWSILAFILTALQ
jgi:hypothetical protein